MDLRRELADGHDQSQSYCGQARDLVDKFTNFEAELREVEPLRDEVMQLRGDTQKLSASRQELSAQVQALNRDLTRAKADLQQVPALKAGLDS